MAVTGTSPSLDEVIAEAEALVASGRTADAARSYESWVAGAQHPNSSAVAHFNLGVLRAELGDAEGAEAAYTEALRLNPGLYQARINAGLAAERQGREADAVRHWLAVAEAVSQGRDDAMAFATMALNHIGRLQESRKHYAAAESALAHSLRLNPLQPDAIQHWVHARQRQCTWPVLAPPPGLTVNRLLASSSPLAMLALVDDPAMQWLSAQAFVARKYPFTEPPLALAPRSGTGRIRIGYLSGDLCTHAVGLLMAELLEAHDRARVHVTAFDFSPEDGTAHRARLRRACDEMVAIHAMTDRQAAEAIRDRGIDVLIDMHGLSSGARPAILALRPAPLIVGYLGFIGTTALPWVDGVITDRFTVPASVQPYMTEQPMYIDGSMIPLSYRPVGPGCAHPRGRGSAEGRGGTRVLQQHLQGDAGHLRELVARPYARPACGAVAPRRQSMGNGVAACACHRSGHRTQPADLLRSVHARRVPRALDAGRRLSRHLPIQRRLDGPGRPGCAPSARHAIGADAGVAYGGGGFCTRPGSTNSSPRASTATSSSL